MVFLDQGGHDPRRNLTEVYDYPQPPGPGQGGSDDIVRRALTRHRPTMRPMAVEPKKLDVHDGDVVEIEGRRYDVVPDKQGGLTLEPAVTISVHDLRRRHDERPATQREIDEQFDLLPPDGEG